MMKRTGAICAAALCVSLAVGCGGGSGEGREKSESPAKRAAVYTVNYPLAYFAERIGGDLVEVIFPAPSDVDPAVWSPGPEAVREYQKADRILLNGAGYAGWIDKTPLPGSKLVRTADGFADRLIHEEGGVTHTHGPGGEHEHGGIAFTIWLDFGLAAEQARAIRDALVALIPGKETVLDENFRALEADLLALDTEMKAAAETIGDETLVASHPVYQYWARRYGIDLVSLHWEPDVIPDRKAMSELKHIVDHHTARWMVWEGEPDPASIELLREAGVESVVFDPCGNAPAEGDFLSIMKGNIAGIGAIGR